MKPLSFAFALSILSCVAAAQRFTHGVSVTVLDVDTKARLPGVTVILRSPMGEFKDLTCVNGHVQWDSGVEPNVVLRGMPFTLFASASGYKVFRREYQSLPISKCAEIRMEFYDIRLESLTRPRTETPPVPAETTPNLPVYDWFRYEYAGYTDHEDCDGMKLFCVDYLDGKAGMKFILTDKDEAKLEAKRGFDFQFGDDTKQGLISLGFHWTDNKTCEKTITKSTIIGDVQYPGKCGKLCLRYQMGTLTWKVWHDYSDGRSYFHKLETRDIVTGFCEWKNFYDCPTSTTATSKPSGGGK